MTEQTKGFELLYDETVAERDKLKSRNFHLRETLSNLSPKIAPVIIERDRLKAANAELLGALEEVRGCLQNDGRSVYAALTIARAVIAKHGGAP